MYICKYKVKKNFDVELMPISSRNFGIKKDNWNVHKSFKTNMESQSFSFPLCVFAEALILARYPDVVCCERSVPFGACGVSGFYNLSELL